MSLTADTSTKAAGEATVSTSGRKREDSPSDVARRGDGLKWALMSGGIVLGIMVFYRLWQLAYAWKYGLDSNAPEFAHYWLSLLVANILGIGAFGAISALYMARGCKTCALQRADDGFVHPGHEAKHIWRLWSCIAGFAASLFSFSFFAEQDAAWHQAVVRDTAFTPSHITLFFGSAPIAVVFAALIYLYAATRVRSVYGKGVPVSLAMFMAGIFLLFMWVAFNEWGHSFWIAEELFSAPLHWGFVVMAFLALSLITVFSQTMGRMVELIKAEREMASK